MAILAYYQRRSLPEWLPAAHLGWGAVGLVTVLYLFYVESNRLHEFCEWCTGVHLLVVLTFVTAFIRWQRITAARYS